MPPNITKSLAAYRQGLVYTTKHGNHCRSRMVQSCRYHSIALKICIIIARNRGFVNEKMARKKKRCTILPKKSHAKAVTVVLPRRYTVAVACAPLGQWRNSPPDCFFVAFALRCKAFAPIAGSNPALHNKNKANGLKPVCFVCIRAPKKYKSKLKALKSTPQNHFFAENR